ncbi:hypothetical protein LCGC14_3001940 [marine sediment metagenome]|uniref:Uncharacterized protein n=1 Tax=marine sediment metagenome TaxID=412755 RepID=A0A0F8X0N2_9ZZZZ
MRIAIVLLALTFSGCQIQAMVLGFSFFRSAQKAEVVTDTGAYMSSSTMVEARGVEFMQALDDNFWNVVKQLGPRLIGSNEDVPETPTAWLERAADDPDLEFRLMQFAAHYCGTAVEQDLACRQLVEAMEVRR